MVAISEVGVEDGGQGKGARNHPEDGQHLGEAQAGAGHGHCQLNTGHTEPVSTSSLQISRQTLRGKRGFMRDLLSLLLCAFNLYS